MTFSTKSVTFDGTSGYVDMGDEAAFQKERTDAFSMSCWAKTRATSAVNTLMAKMTSATGKAGYLMFINASGQFEAVLRNTETTNSLRVRTDASRYNDGGWHHYAMTYDGSGSLKLYVDGIVKTTTTVYNNLTSSILIAKSLQVGAYDGSTDPFQGLIDEVAFFNAELSASAVLDIFSSASPISLSGAPGLVGWWNMGDGDTYPIINARVLGVGTLPIVPDNTVHELDPPIFQTIIDESGNGYRGSMANMEPADIVSDTPGGTFSPKSLSFDGVDEHIVIGDVLNFEYTDSFSISCWFKTTSSGTHMLIAKLGDGVQYRGYQFNLSAGKLRLYFGYYNNFGTVILVESNNTFNDGNWKHAVFTWLGSGSPDASDITFYVNGSLEAHSVITNNLTGSIVTTNPLYLAGRASSGSLYPFNGILGEMAVYDKELSSGEVTAIYNAGIPNDLGLLSSATNLVAWWRMGNSPSKSTGLAVNMGSSNIVRDVPRSDFCKYSTYFDGTADYCTMGNVFGFERTDAFSVSFWFKSTTSTNGYIISKMDVAGSGQIGWGIWLSAGGELYLTLRHQEVVHDMLDLHTDDVFDDGTWHHCIWTYDGSSAASGCACYVDGSIRSTTTVWDALTDSITHSDPLLLGARNNSTGRAVFYNGYLTEVAIYDAELSASDVTWIYNSGLPRDLQIMAAPSNLAAWWRCGTIERVDTYGSLRDLVWGSSPETSLIRDMSRYNNNSTPVNLVAGDFTTDTPGGEAKYSCDFNGDLVSTTSVYFDSGYDNHVTMGNPAALNFDKNDPFSISFWIKTTDTGRTWIMSKQSGSTLYQGYNVQISVDEYLIFNLSSDQTGGDWWGVGSNDTTGWRDGSWHHIVWTIDGSADRAGVTLYIDASPASIFVYGGTTVISGSTITSTPFKLGVRDDEKNNVLRGGMDEWAIYNKELSAAEVTWIYNGGTPRDLTGAGAPSNLVGWWQMGDGDTYPTLQDSSTSGNDGTMTNMAAEDIIGDVPAASPEYLISTNQTELGFREGNGGQWTVGAWVKTTSTSGTIIYRNSWNGTVAGVGWGVGLSRGYPMLWIASSFPTIRDQQRSDVTVNDGAWHHILIRRKSDSSGNPICDFYVDGVSTGRVTELNAFSSQFGTDGNVCIGAMQAYTGGETGYPFKGKIAEVAVWRGYLYSDQIADVYNGGSPPNLIDLDSEPSLAAWWRCGDDSGNPGTPVSLDISQRVGDAPGEEYSIRSLDFNGTDEWVNVGNVLNYERTDAFSVSYWVKSHLEGSTRSPVSKWGSGNIGWYFDPRWAPINHRATSASEFRMANGINAIFMELDYDGHFQVADWYHIAVTYSGNSNASGVTLYINGRERETMYIVDNDLSGAPTIINSDPFSIGHQYGGGYSQGRINEVSIWGKELSQAEVTELYNGGAPASLSTHSAVADLDGWWHLGDEGIDATMTNMDSGDLVTNAPKSPGLIGQPINYYMMRGTYMGADCAQATVYSPLNYSATLDGGELIYFGAYGEIQFQPTDAFTVGCWFKSSTAATNAEAYITLRNWPSARGWDLIRDSSYGFGFQLQKSNSAYFGKNSSVNEADGEWHFIVATYDGTGDEDGITLYFDGELATGIATYALGVVDAIGYASEPLEVGRRGSGQTGNYLQGQICHSFVISRLLTANEVSELYCPGSPIDLETVVDSADIVHWCTLGDGCTIGTGTCPDLSPLNKDGTTLNMEASDFTTADVPSGQGSGSLAAFYHHWVVAGSPDFDGDQSGTLEELYDIILEASWTVNE